MKRLVLIVSLLTLFQSTAIAIGAAYSGSWYNPNESGHGFSLEYTVLSDETPIVVVYWYVYDAEGNPIFLIGLGEPEEGNTVTLEFEAPYGMKFGEFDPNQTIREDGGTGVFKFEDSEKGVFDYNPSEWMINTYNVSSISTPIVKLLGVAHPNPEIIELHIGAKFLTTTEKKGEFPVCFNGAGELLPCESDIEPPVLSDPYSGSWSGRMTFDREHSPQGVCYDADVKIRIEPDYSFAHISSITVNRDEGGQEISSAFDELSADGYVTDTFYLFDDRTDYSIQFNTQGHGEGVWTDGTGCSGLWSFTKD